MHCHQQSSGPTSWIIQCVHRQYPPSIPLDYSHTVNWLSSVPVSCRFNCLSLCTSSSPKVHQEATTCGHCQTVNHCFKSMQWRTQLSKDLDPISLNESKLTHHEYQSGHKGPLLLWFHLRLAPSDICGEPLNTQPDFNKPIQYLNPTWPRVKREKKKQKTPTHGLLFGLMALS